MHSLLILKTGALGDVLRTTSILPGLARAHPELRVTWLTAHAARELVEHHPLVHEVVTVHPESADEIAAAGTELAKRTWQWVLSFDDEEPLCALASRLLTERLSGAHLDESGARAYTDDVAPWFDMGLLSRFGKERADALKIANEASHPAIFASMLGVDASEPELPIAPESEAFGRAFRDKHGLDGRRVLGLNTGAGGRWVSKQLPVERTVAVCKELAERLGRDTGFVVLGGPSEAERNREILAGLASADLSAIDGGVENTIGQFAAIISQLDLLLTSDSLALHIAVARKVPVTAFFAPTSGAEIELFGRGEKVLSTAPDYCTYRRDVDTSTLTVERIRDAVQRSLG